MTDFRPVPAADRSAYRRILQYAFSPERGPAEPTPAEDWPPTLYDQRGLYVDETLTSGCKLYYLDAWVRDGYDEIGGLGAVGTAPEFRGQGHARRLCREALREYRDNDVDIVTLWPFSTSFYERFGWATANYYRRYTLAPDVLPAHDNSGRYVQLETADWKRLRRVETAYGKETSLSLRRSEQWWRERTLADWDGNGTPYCFGYERDGTLEGYVVYTVTKEDGDRVLSVQDLAHTDEEAYRAMLAFLGGHGAQVPEIALERAEYDTLLARVTDPESVSCSVRPGPMARLTSVEPLTSLDWPVDELTATIRVNDPLLENNDGQFELTVTDGVARLENLTNPVDQPAMVVDIGTLTQLYLGTIDCDEAMRFGGLDVFEEPPESVCESVFEPQHVCLREFF